MEPIGHNDRADIRKVSCYVLFPCGSETRHSLIIHVAGRAQHNNVARSESKHADVQIDVGFPRHPEGQRRRDWRCRSKLDKTSPIHGLPSFHANLSLHLLAGASGLRT
jgi:hypothetical protein